MWKQVAILFFLGGNICSTRICKVYPSCGFSTRKNGSQPLSRTMWKTRFQILDLWKKRMKNLGYFLTSPWMFIDAFPDWKKDHDFQPALMLQKGSFSLSHLTGVTINPQLPFGILSAHFLGVGGQPPRINLRVSKSVTSPGNRSVFINRWPDFLGINPWISQFWSISLVFFWQGEIATNSPKLEQISRIEAQSVLNEPSGNSRALM